MVKKPSVKNSRLDNLLLDEATVGLSPAEKAELRALLAECSDNADDEQDNPFMETAALIQLAFASSDNRSEATNPMPDSLRRQLSRAARQQVREDGSASG